MSRPEWGPVLLDLARTSLLEALKLSHAGDAREHRETWLDDPGACFVTLRRLDQLRGHALNDLLPARLRHAPQDRAQDPAPVARGGQLVAPGQAVVGAERRLVGVGDAVQLDRERGRVASRARATRPDSAAAAP